MTRAEPSLFGDFILPGATLSRAIVGASPFVATVAASLVKATGSPDLSDVDVAMLERNGHVGIVWRKP